MYTLGQGPRKQDCSRRIWTQETSRQQHKSRGGTCQKCKRIHVIYIYQGCNPFTCLSSMYIDLPILPVAYIILQNLWHLGGIEQTCCNMFLYIYKLYIMYCPGMFYSVFVPKDYTSNNVTTSLRRNHCIEVMSVNRRQLTLPWRRTWRHPLSSNRRTWGS